MLLKNIKHISKTRYPDKEEEFQFTTQKKLKKLPCISQRRYLAETGIKL